MGEMRTMKPKKVAASEQEPTKRISLKPKVEHAKRERTPQWYDKYTEKHGKMRGLPIGMDESEVQINHAAKDPHGEWLMKYKDKKGVNKTVYTEEFMRRNAEKKWARIKNINPAQVKLVKTQPIKLLDKEGLDDTSKQSLAVIAIIANTGLRPGSRVGYMRTKNRGVSTLHPDNVKITGDRIDFDFIGKSYQQNVSTIVDKKLAQYLTKLKKDRKGEQFLFNVNKTHLMTTFRDKLGFKGLKLKDLRTYVATDLAKNLLFESKLPPLPLADNPKKNKANLQKKLQTVFEAVSQKLNNTPAMAKTSYIHPAVIDAHIISIGMDKTELQKGGEEEKKTVPSLAEIAKNSNYEGKDIETSTDDDEDEDLDVLYPLPAWWDESLMD
jgi:DNA topoisomerase-1